MQHMVYTIFKDELFHLVSYRINRSTERLLRVEMYRYVFSMEEIIYKHLRYIMQTMGEKCHVYVILQNSVYKKFLYHTKQFNPYYTINIDSNCYDKDNSTSGDNQMWVYKNKTTKTKIRSPIEVSLPEAYHL